MDSPKLLKNLRDGLWQAAIELKRPSEECHNDSYEIPLDKIVADLAAHGVLVGNESTRVIEFLNRFAPVDADAPSADVPDDLAGDIARITAELRSVREQSDRDLGGFGKR
jgi:hypothetical protein